MAQAFSSYTQELYPYTVSLVANVKFSAYLEGIASPVKLQIRHSYHLCSGPNGYAAPGNNSYHTSA